MNILILSLKSSIYSTKQLVAQARALGHKPKVVDPLHFSLFIENGKWAVHLRKKRLSRPDVVIPRFGNLSFEWGLGAVDHFELMGVPVINSGRAILQARDKFRCLQLLAHEGIQTPRSVLMRTPANWRVAVEAVGGYPVVVKLIQGTHGVGVFLAENEEALRPLIEGLVSLNQSVMLQEFIGASKGRDTRAFVVGDRVVGAMERHAPEGEFRSNIHRGGDGTVVELSEEDQSIACRAARATNLEICGVDMLRTATATYVIECNPSPGLEGIERATGASIARDIIEYAVARAEGGSPGL